ncbi:hypothetical protein GCM10009639_52310 [Kitasatospora putterlickiae]|uniref:NusG domain-containing protein n=1 Tax=Kitasatospora putterlickiae TaxID=221725 RepID=A0ABN1YD99_9ACTN
MLGWWFLVKAPAAGSDEGEVLAGWETGLGGTNWIRDLVKAGRAEQLRFDGYPLRYTARAGDVLPRIADGSVFDTGPGAEYRRCEVFPERIAVCPSDALLTVDAWDQS